MDTKREPAKIAGAFASAAVALLVAYRVVNAEQALAWDVLLTMGLTMLVPWAQAKWTRGKVFAPATLEAAGLDPAKVAEAAEANRTSVG